MPKEARSIVATADECRVALEKLVSQLAQVDPAHRAEHLVDRAVSCEVTDLGVTFVTRLGPDGGGPVTEVDGSNGAQIKFATRSDDLLAIAGDPSKFVQAWLTGRLRVQASLSDLLRLRRLL